MAVQAHDSEYGGGGGALSAGAYRDAAEAAPSLLVAGRAGVDRRAAPRGLHGSPDRGRVGPFASHGQPGDCAAMSTSTAATCLSPRTGPQSSASPARGPSRYWPTPPCGPWWWTCWVSGGVQSRWRTNCPCGSPIVATGTCCTESGYQAIYDPAAPVTRPAKRRRRRRRRRVQGLERRSRLAAMTIITDRPVEVADVNHRPRKTLGWARPADLLSDTAAATA